MFPILRSSSFWTIFAFDAIRHSQLNLEMDEPAKATADDEYDEEYDTKTRSSGKYDGPRHGHRLGYQRGRGQHGQRRELRRR